MGPDMMADAWQGLRNTSLNLLILTKLVGSPNICDVSESETSVGCFYVSPLWQIIALHVL